MSACAESVVSVGRALVERCLSWCVGDARLEAIALVRILLGLTGVLAYTMNIPYLELMWGADGIVRWAYFPDGPEWVHVYVWWIHAATVLGAVGLTIGLATPLTGSLLVLGHMAFVSQTVNFTWGWGPTFPIFVAYTVLGNGGARYSVDAWLRGRPVSAPWTGSAWMLRTMQVHVAVIYLAAAWHRIDDRAWWDGEMTYEALSCALFSRFPGVDWTPWKPLLTASCHFTWAVELAAPVLLWPRQTRTVIAVGLVLVHVGLEVSSTIGFWQFCMVSMLMVFMPERFVRGVLHAPRRLWRPRPHVQSRSDPGG